MFVRSSVRLRTNSVQFSSAKQRLKNYIFPVIRSEDCVQASIFYRYYIFQKVISGWGPGGQKVNMTKNAVTIKHVATGVIVRVHQSRLLQENIEIALERLKHAVDRHLNGENSYDAQLERMERERGAKNKRKRAVIREMKKIYAQERCNSDSDELDVNPIQAIYAKPSSCTLCKKIAVTLLEIIGIFFLVALWE
ncbi:unnamed protein product [Brugia pahangi]|uniref:RF_PROK_I domain-containing protein n=1 Tax=Brugia pahangi TaxID=6280 RepID=A0A0N4TJV9_BRUPA|nr:unnamed protein product [Brugia pahangi]